MKNGLIIGWGPSKKKLTRLYNSNKFNYILTTDTQLKNCLKEGIIPDYVFTIENISIFYKLFVGIPKDICEKITVIISHRTHPNTIK